MTDPKQKVYIGATAGLRDALSSGATAQSSVDVFEAALAESSAIDATFHLLTGEEEAKFEHFSAAYCARICGFADGPVGLLSSGGMSSQLVHGDRVVSIPTKIKCGNQLGLELGMEKGTNYYRSTVTSAIDKILPTTQYFVGTDGDMFLAIEMLAAAGEKAGIGGQIIPIPEAIEALEEYVIMCKKEEVEAGPYVERKTWRSYVHVMSSIAGVKLLSLLNPNSKILFSRTYSIPESDTPLKPSWALGKALKMLNQ